MDVSHCNWVPHVAYRHSSNNCTVLGRRLVEVTLEVIVFWHVWRAIVSSCDRRRLKLSLSLYGTGPIGCMLDDVIFTATLRSALCLKLNAHLFRISIWHTFVVALCLFGCLLILVDLEVFRSTLKKLRYSLCYVSGWRNRRSQLLPPVHPNLWIDRL